MSFQRDIELGRTAEDMAREALERIGYFATEAEPNWPWIQNEK